MFRLTGRLLVPAALVVAVGCESDPIPPGQGPSFLEAHLAHLEAAFAIEHDGPAEFGSGTRSETERALKIRSYDSDSGGRLDFQLLRSSSTSQFETGVFVLQPRNFSQGHNEGNTAHYRVELVGEWYVAEQGTLTISEVSEDRVEGHFEFTAVFWCDRSVERDPCLTLPEQYPPEAPRLTVVGTFSAEPFPEVPRLASGSN